MSEKIIKVDFGAEKPSYATLEEAQKEALAMNAEELEQREKEQQALNIEAYEAFFANKEENNPVLRVIEDNYGGIELAA